MVEQFFRCLVILLSSYIFYVRQVNEHFFEFSQHDMGLYGWDGVKSPETDRYGWFCACETAG